MFYQFSSIPENAGNFLTDIWEFRQQKYASIEGYCKPKLLRKMGEKGFIIIIRKRKEKRRFCEFNTQRQDQKAKTSRNLPNDLL